jgi:dipeptide/tripeptide permease
VFQAPVSMKSVLQAGWLLTVAFGNLIVVIVAEAKFFDSQVLSMLSIYRNQYQILNCLKYSSDYIYHFLMLFCAWFQNWFSSLKYNATVIY